MISSICMKHSYLKQHSKLFRFFDVYTLEHALMLYCYKRCNEYVGIQHTGHIG